MTTLSFEQVLEAAQQLTPRERARLVALVVAELAELPTTSPQDDGWRRWEQLRTDIAAQHPHADIAGRLESDRQERDAMLRGREATDNVHA